MIRGKFYTGTVAVSSNEGLTLGRNEEVTKIIINQAATASFNVNIRQKGSGTGQRVLFDESGGYDYVIDGDSYIKSLSDMCDIYINNSSGSNEIGYSIWTKEHVA